MKKFSLVVISLCVFLMIMWLKEEKQASSAPLPAPENNSSSLESKVLTQVEDEATKQQSVQDLMTSVQQCKSGQLKYSDKVHSIHQDLIRVLREELEAGKTETELMAYEGQYATFHNGFDDLLLSARLGLEKQKYQFTRSVEILAEWSGLSVIKGFNDEIVSELIAGLQAPPPTGLKMILSLKEEVSHSEVYQLLANKDNFNTYLESPLGIKDVSVISPSVLVMLTATRLELPAFQQAIAQHSFTVNDVAVAINIDLPVEYIIAVLKQTKTPEAMPVLMLGRYKETFFNLADMAAAKHNTRLLQVLATYGVTPSDVPGIVTGLDIAIANMKLYSATQSYPDEYFEVLEYLKNKGYRAHGEVVQLDGVPTVRFSPPNNKSQLSSTVSDPKLERLLESIELISKAERIPQSQDDQSELSNAISIAEEKRQMLQKEQEQCSATENLLREREGFADIAEAREIIRRIEADGIDVAMQLHQIDPTLYTIWYEQIKHRVARPDSAFLNLVRGKKFQQALEYSATHPLTTFETGGLLHAMLSNFDELLSVWQARVTPVAPSSLEILRYLKPEQWQYWHEQGFDLALIDDQGRDAFVAAALSPESSDNIAFLMDKGYVPVLRGLGPDIIDVLLERSYYDGKLHPSLADVLPTIDSFEASHYSRVSRIKQFYPGEYTELIAIEPSLELKNDVPMNRFRLNLKRSY